MPRKKLESVPITGVSRDPAKFLKIQKSRPLSALWRSEYTLSEFKILDTYLSRINSHKPEKRLVRFEKGEIEQLLGVKKINISELQERVTHLMQPLILQDDKSGFHGLALFEQAHCQQDSAGLWTVSIECTQTAMKYFFNVDGLGYFRYKLRSIANLTSRYSYVFFEYLEMNRFRKTWEESLDVLKHLLNCEDVASYAQFKEFNRIVLKRCAAEINEKTECHFSYTPIRKGRAVAGIRFFIETLPDLEPVDPDQISLFDAAECDDQIAFFGGACCPPGSNTPEFDRAQMQELFEVLVVVPDSKLPINVTTGGIEFRRYHFLAFLYAAMNRKDTPEKPIKHRYAYFLKMLKTEAGIA